MSQQWEYKIVETKHRGEELKADLDEAAADGWELVSATSSLKLFIPGYLQMLFFRRPVE
jgi:hypothetical protein